MQKFFCSTLQIREVAQLWTWEVQTSKKYGSYSLWMGPSLVQYQQKWQSGSDLEGMDLGK